MVLLDISCVILRKAHLVHLQILLCIPYYMKSLSSRVVNDCSRIANENISSGDEITTYSRNHMLSVPLGPKYVHQDMGYFHIWSLQLHFMATLESHCDLYTLIINSIMFELLLKVSIKITGSFPLVSFLATGHNICYVWPLYIEGKFGKYTYLNWHDVSQCLMQINANQYQSMPWQWSIIPLNAKQFLSSIVRNWLALIDIDWHWSTSIA